MKKRKKIWAPKPITQDAVFQCVSDMSRSKSSSLSVKLIPSVWRIGTLLSLLCRHMRAVYDALGCQRCSPSLSLLTAPISTRCSFVSVCLCSKNTYLMRSVQGWLCGSHNEVPEKFLHAGYRALPESVQL